MGSHSVQVIEAIGTIRQPVHRFVGFEPSLVNIFDERNIHSKENCNQTEY
jgi:hypothetical protein